MRKDDITLARLANRKRIRTIVRLETSIQADSIIDDLLDQADTEFDRRVLSGGPYTLVEYEGWVMQAVRERFAALEPGDA